MYTPRRGMAGVYTGMTIGSVVILFDTDQNFPDCKLHFFIPVALK